jgi:hypothetical protein
MTKLRDLWRREPVMCCAVADLAAGAVAVVAVGVFNAPWGLTTSLCAWLHGALAILARNNVTPWTQ